MLRALAQLAALGAARAGSAQTLSTAGTPTLRVSSAVAGSAPTVVSVSTTTISYTTPNGGPGLRLQANVASALPAGVTLEISVTAPSGSTSSGFVTMSTSYANLTAGIPKNSSGTLTVTHRLTATSAAGVLGPATRTVNFRLF